MTLFTDAQIAGTFLGFSEGGLEFHADLVLPYESSFQSRAMHGQFVLVALENDNEAVLGRITTISSQGRLVTPSGEDYAIRAVREDRPIPEDLRDQYLKYRVNIRILGILRAQAGDKPPLFIASHRRLPHVGAKVAFLSNKLLAHVAGASEDSDAGAEIGFLALGEFVYAGNDCRFEDDDRFARLEPSIVPRFDLNQLVSRRSFVFARAGFGKSNLIKLLFSDLYGLVTEPTVQKRLGQRRPVGTVIFDPDGEYFWPDFNNRPGLCDVPGLRDRLVVFTDRVGPSPFYSSFIVDRVKLDVRDLSAAKVVSLALPQDSQDRQNVAKLKALSPDPWRELVDLVWANGHAADETKIMEILGLKPNQEMELYAARANMVRIVRALHDPSSQLLRSLKQALSDGKLCVVDISRMRGSQGLQLAGVILQEIFEHNQNEFTAANPNTIATIAVIEEAQAVLGSTVSHGEGPFVEWVKEGRKYDLGAVLVTQQPGSLPEELLSQGDNWFIFHLLSSGDLRVLKNANAHFSDDLLATLLNEPLVGHGVFWSSAGSAPYPIPIKALSFERSFQALDPTYDSPAIDNYASKLAGQYRRAIERAVEAAGAVSAPDGEVDAAQTLENAAIAELGRNQDFQAKVRTTKGIPWGEVMSLLEDGLPASSGTSSSDWAYRIVPRALNSILGRSGWTAEPRPRVNDPGRTTKWIVATASALPAMTAEVKLERPSPESDEREDESLF